MKTYFGFHLLFITILISTYSTAQWDRTQYFDGADTSAQFALFIDLDTSVSNIWQIGPPQKAIFDTAATQPNVIVTDTVLPYPANNWSRFSTQIPLENFNWGILAIQWLQKLDMRHDLDGGMIEFSIDSGLTWQNAFEDPNVYNFYGFSSANQDTLPSGDIVFSGTDSTWKDIWLCYDLSWVSNFTDTLRVRYTFMSDSLTPANTKEGWMIDNMQAHETLVHTIEELEHEDYLWIHPNPTSGRVHIEAQKVQGYHIIEGMELINEQGKIVQTFGLSPTKYWIDISAHPDGAYFLKITTNIRTETLPIILQR